MCMYEEELVAGARELIFLLVLQAIDSFNYNIWLTIRFESGVLNFYLISHQKAQLYHGNAKAN